MSRALDDLHPAFRPQATEYVARLVEAGFVFLIVDTLRTPEEHAYNLEHGTSWSRVSNHLYGLAIDVCPYAEYRLHGADKLMWDWRNPVWTKMGEIGERMGLDWGGRWRQKDMAHFEHARASRIRDLVPWPVAA